MAATEMGGRLTAQSGGVGQGAVFCLELPFNQRSAENSQNARGTTNVHPDS